jgi:antirestriction protein ArdC
MATKNTDTAARADIYQTVTDRIVAAIEAGAGEWKMPWHANKGGTSLVPVNAVSGKVYRGINVLILWSSGSESQTWATYLQWSELGCQVRAGSRGQQIVFFKKLEDREDDQVDNPAEDEERRRFVIKGFTVFSADQVEGYEPKFEAPTCDSALQRIEEAEAFVRATGADIRHGGSRAFYSPIADYIQLPPLETFSDIEGYYGTALHELVHFTGSKTRLDRDLSAGSGRSPTRRRNWSPSWAPRFFALRWALRASPGKIMRLTWRAG